MNLGQIAGRRKCVIEWVARREAFSIEQRVSPELILNVNEWKASFRFSTATSTKTSWHQLFNLNQQTDPASVDLTKENYLYASGGTAGVRVDLGKIHSHLRLDITCSFGCDAFNYGCNHKTKTAQDSQANRQTGSPW